MEKRWKCVKDLQMLYLPEGFDRWSFKAPLGAERFTCSEENDPFVQEHVLHVEGLSERFHPGQPV